jgi:predicted DNA-binding WGR domain protein
MSEVTTRSFVCEKDGVRYFLELSWTGPEVEIVSGKLGTRGRSRRRVFDTVAKRDAFIAERVRKAEEEGYVAGASGDVPTPDVPGPLDREQRLRREYGRVAYVPSVVDCEDDARDGSKFGGAPWIAPGDLWPLCERCGDPLPLYFQLRRDEVPAESRWAFRDEGLQVFACDECVFRSPHEGLLLRHVSLHGVGRDPQESLGDGFRIDRQVATEVLRATWIIRRTTTRGKIDQDVCIAWPKRIAGWVPTADIRRDVDDDVAEELYELEVHCLRGDKLGGWPDWVDEPTVAACATCRHDMDYFFQVDSDCNLPVIFGDAGTAWVFVCRECARGALRWQCT